MPTYQTNDSKLSGTQQSCIVPPEIKSYKINEYQLDMIEMTKRDGLLEATLMSVAVFVGLIPTAIQIIVKIFNETSLSFTDAINLMIFSIAIGGSVLGAIVFQNRKRVSSDIFKKIKNGIVEGERLR